MFILGVACMCIVLYAIVFRNLSLLLCYSGDLTELIFYNCDGSMRKYNSSPLFNQRTFIKKALEKNCPQKYRLCSKCQRKINICNILLPSQTIFISTSMKSAAASQLLELGIHVFHCSQSLSDRR